MVREAFRALGHNAWSCDLQPARDSQHRHMQMDVRAAIRAGVPTTGARWDLGIFHPVCTYLCNSGVSRLTNPPPPNPSAGVLYGPARWAAMREAAVFFVELLTADIPLIAVENPQMHKHARAAIADALFRRQHTPIDGTYTAEQYARPTQMIQPFQFGDDASKNTGLWLRGGGLAPLRSLPLTQWVSPRYVCADCRNTLYHGWAGNECGKCGGLKFRPRWANQTDSGQNKLTPSETRARDRAATYPGIAAAMALQWGGDATSRTSERSRSVRGASAR